MSTDLIDNKVEESNGVARNIDNIKKSYPDEWVLLGNPVSDEYNRTLYCIIAVIKGNWRTATSRC